MPIRARLLALVALPLIGLCLFAVQDAGADWRTASEAEALRGEIDLLDVVLDVNRSLNSEFDQGLGLAEVARLGLDLGGHGTDGVDLDLGLTNAERASDIALDRLWTADAEGATWADPAPIQTLLGARDDIDEIRVSVDRPAVSIERLASLQRALTDAAATAVRAQLDRLLIRPLVFESPGIADALRTQEASVAFQEISRSETRSLTSMLLPFTALDAERPQYTFIGDARESEERRDELMLLLPEDLAAEFTVMQQQSTWNAYAALREQALLFDVSPNGSSGDTADGMGSVGATLLEASMVRSGDLGALDQQIRVVTADRALDAQRSSQSKFVETLVLLVALVVATMVLTGVIIRSIAGPLKRLERQAVRISEGTLPAERSSHISPRDLASVELALSSLAEGLNVVGLQASALANGALESSVLDWSAPGRLGESLRGSVEKLRQLNATLDHQATHDLLTGLPNRAALLQFLDRTSTGSMADRRPILAIMLDLDGFKQSNDMLGHPIGDELLRHTADRLRERSQGGFLGRLGGDEFMVLFEGPVHRDPVALARTMIDGLTEPFSTSVGAIWLSASAGIVQSSAQNWLSPAEILQRSDLALLQAKAAGQAAIVEFDEHLSDAVLERSRIQGELRVALERDLLELHFQPIVAAPNDRVSGVEALLRWFDAAGNSIPPNVFIPAAEQSDLILMIDNWVIRQACRTLAMWSEDPVMAGLTISINVSGRHVASTELVDVVRSALESTGARADLLVIEMTETEVIPNLELAVAVFDQLKALGVSLAIDDFGTGFASVAHLRRIPFDRLKIDRSFISQLDDDTDRSIARLLVSLGQSLDLQVVAEGVETSAQRSWCIEAGCTHLQGYFFARPCNVNEIAAAVTDIALQPSPI